MVALNVSIHYIVFQRNVHACLQLNLCYMGWLLVWLRDEVTHTGSNNIQSSVVTCIRAITDSGNVNSKHIYAVNRCSENTVTVDRMVAVANVGNGIVKNNILILSLKRIQLNSVKWEWLVKSHFKIFREFNKHWPYFLPI